MTDDKVNVSAQKYADLLSLAADVKQTIEARHKHRGSTSGKRLWELKLLHKANVALGVPSVEPKEPDRCR